MPLVKGWYAIVPLGYMHNMDRDALVESLTKWADGLTAASRNRFSTYDLRALYDAAQRAKRDGSARALHAWVRELSPAARDSLSESDVAQLASIIEPADGNRGATTPVIALAPTELGPPSRPEHARLGGYTGDSCRTCGGSALVRSGTCVTCLDCGTNSGCS